jgi:hypothetical protein
MVYSPEALGILPKEGNMLSLYTIPNSPLTISKLQVHNNSYGNEIVKQESELKEMRPQFTIPSRSNPSGWANNESEMLRKTIEYGTTHPNESRRLVNASPRDWIRLPRTPKAAAPTGWWNRLTTGLVNPAGKKLSEFAKTFLNTDEPSHSPISDRPLAGPASVASRPAIDRLAR